MRKKILRLFKEKLEDEDALIFPISAITRKGLMNLLFAVADLIEVTPEFPLMKLKRKKKILFFINMKGKRWTSKLHVMMTEHYVLSGYTIERLFKMTDFNFDQSVRKFARQMRGMGIDDALRERGAKDGDTVRILDFEFEFIE